MLAIESIWGCLGASGKGKPTECKVLPLRYFITETLRRSRSSCSTLQIALYYLHKSRAIIRERVQRAEMLKKRFTALAEAREMDDNAEEGSMIADELTALAAEVLACSKDPVTCGRRMFLASLISASKYLQDRK